MCSRTKISDAAFAKRIARAQSVVTEHLWDLYHADGYWLGRLSSSSLATATAVSALAVAANLEERRPLDDPLVMNGLTWLLKDQKSDGGWGDTPESPSNLSTSALTVAAIRIAGDGGEKCSSSLNAADAYLKTHRDGYDLATAINRVYGRDRTFAVPILVNCALARMVDWKRIPRLPYPMAIFPASLFRHLRLQVVSYALPALIAMGLAIDHHNKPGLLRGLIRKWTQKRVLSRLRAIQPATGGYLEATPLSSFVAISMLPVYGATHPVVKDCLGFIRSEVRPDGSWPIDSNLSVWVTSHAVKALLPATTASRAAAIDTDQKRDLAPVERWLTARQHIRRHPYTGSAPGGWSWTHLDGGVPDTDDTSSATIALLNLGNRSAIPAGVRWLLAMQNADGGWPTFCRGWGKLPFDRSSPDLTAHALRALSAAKDADACGATAQAQVTTAIKRGLDYLRRNRLADGTWTPLWFGSQDTADGSNPLLGTALVLIALAYVPGTRSLAEPALDYLRNIQRTDGGWGAMSDIAPTIEESALATTAMQLHLPGSSAAERGMEYLVMRIEDDSWRVSAPVGLYFASLWYDEKLYPVLWTLQALNSRR